MKITAEFNSNEELLNFISTFGTKSVTQINRGVEAPKRVQNIKEDVELTKPVQLHSPEKEGVKEDATPTVKVEEIKEEPKQEGPTVDAAVKEETEPTITKEMVRAVFTKLIKAGKQKEAKDLTKKYGASKLPEVKEEDFATIYKEAEALL